MLSLQCVFVFCQSPMVEPTFEDDDPDNWSSRRAALLCFAGAAQKVCRVLECVACVGDRGTSSVDGVGCMSWWTVTFLCSTVHVCVCACVCARVQVLSRRMPPGCQHIWTVMDYLGLGCYSKRETPATGGGGVHIKCIGYLIILVVCSLSCHCVPTVWHSEDCVVCAAPLSYIEVSSGVGVSSSTRVWSQHGVSREWKGR